MQTLRSFACAIAALGFIGTAACTSDATLRVENDSQFAIVELYLTEVDNPNWGPNLLGDEPLFPDDALTLSVGCDFYDALLIDEDDVECELQSLDLCANDALWIINNNTCTVFNAARAAREAEEAQKAASPAANLSTTL